MWERELKQCVSYNISIKEEVAPYVGACVETILLKNFIKFQEVAPYVGACVETDFSKFVSIIGSAIPYVGICVERSIILFVIINNIRFLFIVLVIFCVGA